MACSGFVENWQYGKSLSESNLHMLTSEICCDVSFRVGIDEATVQAHRYVLISRSCVFSAMLCGPLAEKGEIDIKDVSTEEFKDFLRYLYTELPVLTPENATTMLYLAKKYAVGSLEKESVSYLETCLSPDNACIILEQAHTFDENRLFTLALCHIQKNPLTVLCSLSFKDLCPECFHTVLITAEITSLPEQAFRAALTWSVAECWRKDLKATPDNKRKVLGSNINQIYFPDMEKSFFVKTVVPSKVLTDAEHVKILSYHACPEAGISPFKTRFQRKKALQTVAKKQVVTADYMMYEQHIKLTGVSEWRKTCDDFHLICTDKVLLHGMYVYGSGRQHIFPHKYHVKVFQQNTLNCGWLVYDFEVSPESISNRNGISTARLGMPMSLERHTLYHFQVCMIAGDLPFCTGWNKQLKVKNGKFSLTSNTGTSKVKFISGFLFSAPCKELTMMTPEKISVHL